MAAEVANMASYYGNALLTLSVAATPSCVEGFLGPDRTQQKINWIQFEIPFITPSSGQLRLPLQPAGDPRQVIDIRAWALQETLLSKRLVTIGPQATSWSCPAVTYGSIHFQHLRLSLMDLNCEGFRQPNRSLTNVTSGRPWEDHDTVADWWSARQLFSSPFIFSKQPQKAEGPEEIVKWYEAEPALLAWANITSWYVQQFLSNQSDILNGISGIAEELSRHFSDNHCGVDAPKYRAGLWWSHYLPVQLLWTPRAMDPNNSCSRCTVYSAPSWSWATIQTPYHRVQPPFVLDSRCFGNVKVLSCHVKRLSPRAPYGAVTEGHLILEARVVQIDGETVGLVDAYRILPSGDTEDISITDLVNGSRAITLVEILTEMTIDEHGFGPGLGIRGLILEKIEDDSYRRIGVFGHQSETGMTLLKGKHRICVSRIVLEESSLLD
ncbi:hypothetical protein V8F06_014609 [Rhypophila decipiens]